MSHRLPARFLVASALLAAAVASPLTAQTLTVPLEGERWERARQQILRAKTEAQAIPGQARALAGFAWPADGAATLEAQVLARDELVGFAGHGTEALHEKLEQAAPVHQADVVAALIQAQRRITSGIAPDLLPALDEAVWFGSIEAKRLAMQQLARFGYRSSVLTIIDAARAHPQLVPTAVRALGRLADPRARRYLGEVLEHGHARERRLAAEALVAIGDLALDVLREATRSATSDVRTTAVRALVPHTGLDDLTVLHEYVARHGAEDDPAVVALVRERAELLEGLLEEQLESAAGSEP
jgi:hypothetical protein